MTMHSKASGRIYEAAGGGYAESFDSGATWQTVNDGLEPYSYLVGIAVDPGDENTVVASAAKGPRSAYEPSKADTILVRRENGEEWKPVYEGLPDREGSAIFSLASDPDDPGVFYGINNLGFYISKDSGLTWDKTPVDWSEHLKSKRTHWMTLG
ncbi:WD40/YVTN/BNR-like repeat-containing protein [Salinicoccus sp. HZC-1]|uniref:WD40/YVTN/BNR-like repeat-containing protein n=1 Tax=Salinicoccus sp. HZC-1 TaxID=3385497 RepID=UPI00398A9103